MQRTTIALAAATLTAVAAPAFAGSNASASINACAEAIRAELPIASDAVDVSFKRIKGTSRVQTLTLKVQADDVRDRVTCKVRRDEAPVLEFGKKLEAYRVELVNRKAATTPSAN